MKPQKSQLLSPRHLPRLLPIRKKRREGTAALTGNRRDMDSSQIEMHMHGMRDTTRESNDETASTHTQGCMSVCMYVCMYVGVYTYACVSVCA